MAISSETRRTLIGAAALLVIAGAVIYALGRSWHGNPAAQAEVMLKCTSCGEGHRTNVAWVSSHSSKLLVDPGYPGSPCQKCGQDALAEALECPKDHTVFFTKYRERAVPGQEGAAARTTCPQCGYDPVAARLEELRKLMPG